GLRGEGRQERGSRSRGRAGQERRARPRDEGHEGGADDRRLRRRRRHDRGTAPASARRPRGPGFARQEIVSRVLIVADQAPERDVMAAAIAQAPHTVWAVAPGDLRIMAVREWDPDVIVMDLAPDGAALPLRMSMLRDPTIASVPFIAVGESEDEA